MSPALLFSKAVDICHLYPLTPVNNETDLLHLDRPIGRTATNRAYGVKAIDGNATPQNSITAHIGDAASYTTKEAAVRTPMYTRTDTIICYLTRRHNAQFTQFLSGMPPISRTSVHYSQQTSVYYMRSSRTPW